MAVITTHKDADNLTLTIVAEFEATPERVWDVWEYARQLERWWGPPTYPATFTRHDFVVGGESRYFMTGPDGDQPHGWWRISAIEKPHRIAFANGLAGDDGEPAPGVEPMPTDVTLERTDDGTRMTIVTHFIDAEQMEKMASMGMEEGFAGAVGQIDALLHAATAA